MEINKRDRAELKSYFVKNAIPTESNFAEMIDAMLNQKDEGIVKLPGNPLSIQAAGDDTSKKVINFYQNFADAGPSWVLSLKPGGKPGFNISDGNNNSRLFIDQNSGNMGIGTPTPKNKLDVEGGAVIGAGYSGTSTAPAQGLLIQGNVGIGTPTPKNKLDVEGGAVVGSTFSGSKTAPTNGLLVQGNVGIGTDVALDRLDVVGDIRIRGADIKDAGGTARITLTNNGRLDLKEDQGAVALSIATNGNVGIGTSNPSHKFHVRTGDAVGLFESAGTQAYLRFVTKEGMNNRVEIANRPEGRLALWVGGAGDVLNILRSGYVGIGKTNPRKRLHISGARVSNPMIIENGYANTVNARTVLDSLSNNSLIIGGPSGNRLWFYWKDHAGNKYQVSIVGSAL